jgi:hypothetical protein
MVPYKPLTALDIRGTIPSYGTMHAESSPSPKPLSLLQEPGVVAVLAEMRALNAGLDVLETRSKREPAFATIREFAASFVSEDFGDSVKLAAMKLCIGEPPPKLERPRFHSSKEQFVADVVSFAWYSWATGNSKQAQKLLEDLYARDQEPTTGALHLLTLSFWASAVMLLVQNDPTNAKRFFKRALDLGSHFGTESHVIISWAYLATQVTARRSLVPLTL